MPLTYRQEADFRQQRDFGQKVSATFEFIGAHWRPLGKVLLYLVLPAALLQGLVGAVLQTQLLGAMRGLMLDGGSRLDSQREVLALSLQQPLYYVNALLGLLLTALLALSVYGYVRRCLEAQGDPTPITPGVVWRDISGRLPGAMLSAVGLGLLIGLGFLVLLLPGIYLGVVLSLFFAVYVLEPADFSGALGRCFTLIKGKWWSTLGLIFIMVLLLYVLLIGVGIIVGLVGASARGLISWSGNTPALLVIVVTLASSLLRLLLAPPLLLALGFQYFNLVERHEGVGLRQLVSQLGRPADPGSQPGATTYRPHEEGEY